MQILKGRGKIYTGQGEYLDKVTYEIYLKSPTKSHRGKWWGEITPDKGIMLVGDYIIELDDGSKGPCITRMRTNSSFGLVVDSYDIEGAGPLTPQE